MMDTTKIQAALSTIGSGLYRAGAAFCRFFGPVAGAVKSDLSKEERIRALSKAVLVGGVTKAALWASLTQPQTLADVFVPLGAAAIVGGLDAISRFQQGDAPPPAPPGPPPPPPYDPTMGPPPAPQYYAPQPYAPPCAPPPTNSPSDSTEPWRPQ